MQGTKSGGGSVGNSAGASAQVAVVAAEPLLLPGVQSNAFVLTLYGIPGSNYVIQSSSTLNGGWQSNLTLTLTNIANPIIYGGGPSNPPMQFYRAYKQ